MAKADKTTKTKEAKILKPLADLQSDLKIARKSFIEGTLTNPHAIKSIKKDIARAKTLENAKKGEK